MVGIARVVFGIIVFTGFRVVNSDVRLRAVRNFHVTFGAVLGRKFCIQCGCRIIAGIDALYVILAVFDEEFRKQFVLVLRFQSVLRFISERTFVCRAVNRITGYRVGAVAHVQSLSVGGLVVGNAARIVYVVRDCIARFVHLGDVCVSYGCGGVSRIRFVIEIGMRFVRPDSAVSRGRKRRRCVARNQAVDKVDDIYARYLKQSEFLASVGVLLLEEVRHVDICGAFVARIGYYGKRRYRIGRGVVSRQRNLKVDIADFEAHIFDAEQETYRRFYRETDVDSVFYYEFGFKVAHYAFQDVCKGHAFLFVNLQLTFESERKSVYFVRIGKFRPLNVRRRDKVCFRAEFRQEQRNVNVRCIGVEVDCHKPSSHVLIEFRGKIFGVGIFVPAVNHVMAGGFVKIISDSVIFFFISDFDEFVGEVAEVNRNSAEQRLAEVGHYLIIVSVERAEQYIVEKVREVTVHQRYAQRFIARFDTAHYCAHYLEHFFERFVGSRSRSFFTRSRFGNESASRTACHRFFNDIHQEAAGHAHVGHSEAVEHQVNIAVRDVNADEFVPVGLSIEGNLRFYERKHRFDCRINVGRIETLLKLVQ